MPRQPHALRNPLSLSNSLAAPVAPSDYGIIPCISHSTVQKVLGQPLRIGFDARFISDHFPGIGRYTAHLLRALVALCAQQRAHTLVVLHNPALSNTRHSLHFLDDAPNVEHITTAARPFSPGEQYALPIIARRHHLDLLHSPYYIKPYLPLGCPSIVTIHDLIGRRFPQFFTPTTRILFRLTSALAIRTSHHLITVSYSSARDIHRVYRIPRERLTIIPEAADAQFCPQSHVRIAAMRSTYALPPRYVLYLGSNKPHKNLVRLVQAWRPIHERYTQESPETRPHLVLAGHHDPRYPEAEQVVHETGMTETVLFRPNIAEHDLPSLYSGAEFFVYPSYYEGFGLPPLEAMACGIPVMVARASSLPEVVGDAAVMVDPHSTHDITTRLLLLLNTPALRAYLRSHGLQRARQFSWHRAAHETMQVYEAVGSARSHSRRATRS